MSYNLIYPNSYFWRTVAQQEIDYIEEKGGKLLAYEFKWKKNAKMKLPSSFIKAYPDSEFKWINPENYSGFLG